MSASSSVKHPSLLHTGAPVCQKNGRRLARGGGESPKSEARSRRDSCSTRPPGGHLRGLGFPQSGSPTPGLPPTPCTSFQSPPLPPGSIPFLWVPLPAAATPAPAASRPALAAPGPARALVAAPATAVRTLRRPAPPSPSPRPERCWPRSRRARQFGPVSFSGQDSLPVAVTFRPFHRCVLGGPLPPPPLAETWRQ